MLLLLIRLVVAPDGYTGRKRDIAIWRSFLTAGDMEQEIVAGDGKKPTATVGKGGEAWGLDSVQGPALQPQAQWAVRRPWFIFALVPLPLAKHKENQTPVNKAHLLLQRRIPGLVGDAIRLQD